MCVRIFSRLLILIGKKMENKNLTMSSVPEDNRKEGKERVLFNNYFELQIERLKMQQRYGTARNYKRTLASFSDYLGGRELFLDEVDEALIVGYSVFLQKKGVIRNTTSFYMRILRANFNQAVKDNLLDGSNFFEHVYTGVDNTRKRSVNEDVIGQLIRLPLKPGSSLELARDLFIFSFCTRGMTFVDMAFLKESDLSEGSISYVRQKTGHRISIKLEPCMQRIVEKYRERNAPFMFPIIRSRENKDAYRQYCTALGYFNKQLKRLSSMVELEVPLTSYVARHTWATTARNHNIPISVISAGMGHSSEETTRIYLASLSDSVIDRANNSLLQSLHLNSVK